MSTEFKKVTPEMIDAILREAAAANTNSILVPSTGDEIPLHEMEACISLNGQMPPLPPLPPEETIRDMTDQALAFLARIVSVASVAFAHLRQKVDFDYAIGQMVVLERHMLQRRGVIGELLQ